MPEFNIRTDSVDVEQIMRQIRARIKEKRGVDYTEQQIEELANVKLQRFLDPKGVRSDLVEQFKRTRGTSPEPPNYSFEDTTLYETHRGIIRLFRRLLNPLLKLLFNPNPIVHVLHMQGQINNINAQQFRVREELDALYYEVIHNLVLEVTRLGIESKNLKMRLESLSSRMDFDERRARALEGVVQYKAGTGPAREPQQPVPISRSAEAARPQPRASAPSIAAEPAPDPGAGGSAGIPGGEQPAEGAAGALGGTARRRRRRRRGRRGGRGRGLGDTATGAEMGGRQGDHGDSIGVPGSQDAGGSGLPGGPPQSEFDDSEADGSDSAPSGDSEDDHDPESSEQ